MTALLVLSYWWEEENLVAAEQLEGLVPSHSLAKVF